MPVEWRATLGYGFKIDMEALFENIEDQDDYIVQDFDSTMPERYPMLTIGYAGNMMSGDGHETWAFVKESVIELREWTATVDYQKMTDVMSAEGMDELFRFVQDTGAVTGDLEWKILLYCG